MICMFSIGLVYFCYQKVRREEGNGGGNARQEAGLRSGTDTASLGRPPAPIQLVDVDNAGSEDSRENIIERAKARLFRAEVSGGDDVRSIQSILASARDDDRRQDRGGNHDEHQEMMVQEEDIEAATGEQGRKCMRSQRMDSTTGREALECSICLDGYGPNQTVCWSMRDDCDHIFHEGCILEWILSGKRDCPLCRSDLISFEPPTNW